VILTGVLLPTADCSCCVDRAAVASLTLGVQSAVAPAVDLYARSISSEQFVRRRSRHQPRVSGVGVGPSSTGVSTLLYLMIVSQASSATH
jgi:hypothetical protein